MSNALAPSPSNAGSPMRAIPPTRGAAPTRTAPASVSYATALAHPVDTDGNASPAPSQAATGVPPVVSSVPIDEPPTGGSATESGATGYGKGDVDPIDIGRGISVCAIYSWSFPRWLQDRVAVGLWGMHRWFFVTQRKLVTRYAVASACALLLVAASCVAPKRSVERTADAVFARPCIRPQDLDTLTNEFAVWIERDRPGFRSYAWAHRSDNHSLVVAGVLTQRVALVELLAEAIMRVEERVVTALPLDGVVDAPERELLDRFFARPTAPF